MIFQGKSGAGLLALTPPRGFHVLLLGQVCNSIWERLFFDMISLYSPGCPRIRGDAPGLGLPGAEMEGV